MEDYLEFAKQLAHDAGAIMLEHFKLGVDKQLKADATPVTIADTTINAMVVEKIMAAYPDHSVLGEEESSNGEHGQFVWVCDPIDGTIGYTLGIPTSMFSLALVKDGVSQLGLLYDPYQDRLYTATKGGGAFLNGEPIKVNGEAVPGGYVGLAGMQYGVLNIASILNEAVGSGIRSLSLCCLTYESALVACGQLAAAIFSGKTVWDVAAVKVIVEEAGGKVTDLHGKEQRYDQPIFGAVISNGVSHDDLVALAEKHIAQPA